MLPRALLLLVLAGCDGDAPASAPAGDCADLPPVTWEGFAAGFFRSYCGACHTPGSPDRHGAPEGVDFASEADAARLADRVRARVLVDGDMPVGGGVPEDDLALLELWLDCGVDR